MAAESNCYQGGHAYGPSIARRAAIQAGSLGVLGLGLADVFVARAQAAATTVVPDKSVIFVFLTGGLSHQDSFDLKPEAPDSVRGEFGPIATTVPGILVGEHVPHVARQAHRFALVRSVTHPDNTHTVAMHYMLTGQRHAQPSTNPRNQPGDFPTFGAVVRYLHPGRGPLPSGISLNAPANQVSAANHIFPGFFAGLLGSSFDPLFIAQDPSRPDFNPFPAPQGVDAGRLTRRRDLLGEVDRRRQALESSAAARALDGYHEQALALVASPLARQAFDLSREDARTRDRYGRSPFGQGLLLARRLVEAGVRLVTVNWARDDAFWDTHANNFRQLKDSLLPPFDRAFAALLEDLDQRGLLGETLVVCLGEFGRTPAINRQAGRDHWAACNSVVLAGGGVRGGQVYGSSDRQAAYPATNPVTPQNLAATIYHALGIPLDTELRDPLGRPLTLCTGTPLTGLFG